MFDLVNALLKPKGLQLKHMWRDAAAQLDFVDTERMNVYILQVMSILRQGYCSPKYLYYLFPGQEKLVRDPDGSLHKEVLVTDTADFQRPLGQRGRGAREGDQTAASSSGVRRDLVAYLPYVSILPVFAALQAHVNDPPCRATTRCPAKNPPLVLGLSFH